MNKLLVLLVGILIIAASLVIPNEFNTVEATGDGGAAESIGLDTNYTWNVIENVSNMIYTAYNGTDIRKGRYFGSKGDQLEFCNPLLELSDRITEG